MLRSKHQILSRTPQMHNRRSDKFDFYRECSTNPPLFVQTNPISKTPKITTNPVLTKDYGKTAPPARPQNEPKRTQTNPKQTQFLARQGPPKPKQTQTNPICRPSGGRQAGTNSKRSGDPCGAASQISQTGDHTNPLPADKRWIGGISVD
jgi:hypothetical protein